MNSYCCCSAGAQAPSRPQARTAAGNSLVEFMLVLAIVALLGQLATGRYQQTQAYMAGIQESNSITSLFELARLQALAQARRVSVCSLRAGRCESSSDGNLSVFSDEGQVGRVDGADQLLGSYRPATGLWRVVASRRYLSFLSDGSVNQPGSYYLCHRNDWLWSQRVVLSKPGRVRVASEAESDYRARLEQYCR